MTTPNSMAIIVREITPDDAEALAHIIVTATKHAFTGLVPDVYATWLSEDERAACCVQAMADGRDVAEALAMAEDAKSAANWRRSMAHEWEPSEILLAAEYDGEMVGFAIGRPSAGDLEYRGELTALYVLPSHQGRGVGRILLRAVAQRLAMQGIHSLKVGVLRVNPNRPFYERLGAQYLYDREYNESGFVQPECVYGWKDTRELMEGTV
jgi:GNAT superfamily N-acetyltransferase